VLSWRSVATWMERHAPPESDVSAAQAWLAEQGMRVEVVGANRLLLEFTGTVG
jgi:kumamolisin